MIFYYHHHLFFQVILIKPDLVARKSINNTYRTQPLFNLTLSVPAALADCGRFLARFLIFVA